jgi:hypothetical protein
MIVEQTSLIICVGFAVLGIFGMRASQDDSLGFGGFALMFIGLCMLIVSIVCGVVLLLMKGWPF